MEDVRTLRVNTNIGSVQHEEYPYDRQYPTIELLSRENSQSLVQLNARTWNRMTGSNESATDVTIGYNDVSTIQNPYYGDNSEWELLGYKYEIKEVTDTVSQNSFSELGKDKQILNLITKN